MRLAVLVALAAFAATAHAEPVPPAVLADEATERALTALALRDFAAVAAAFDPGMAPTRAEVASVWAAKAGTLGKLARWTIVDRTRQDGFETRLVRLELARGELAALLSVTDGGRLASLFIAPPARAPRYIDPARFRELPIVVGSAELPLPGTLTVPTGAGPFAAVVLVHGSGPNDRDSTVGANKIFRDLARGLATSGIAVLRYDKRTFVHGARLTDAITLDDEVVDDAVAAARALAQRPEVDPRRVFVLGHSLGGLLAPEIAVRAGGIAGVALLAPPGRPPWEIIREQMHYLRAPPDTIAAVERAIIDITFGGAPSLLGIPFAYWRDWAGRDGVAMARALGRPVLVLRGSRDYQVTIEDLAIWRTGLRELAEVWTFAGANHLFIRGTGAPGPLEYKVPGHVDEHVIARLIAFVRRTGS